MHASRLARHAGGLAALLTVLLPALAAPVTIDRRASSSITSQGVLQVEDDGSPPPGSVIDPGTASAQALWPPSPLDAQGRTAARSTANDFAANARIVSNGFDLRNQGSFDRVMSVAHYVLHAEGALVPQRASFEFFLPPSYVELVTNAETPHPDMSAFVVASLRICFAQGCSDPDTVFRLQGRLSGDHFGFLHNVLTEGDPQLDLSPLQAAAPVVTDDGFIRTVLLEFPAYSGIVDLGLVPVGEPVHVEYQLQARVDGEVWFSSATAAINDPFFLDSDPVRPSPAGVLTLTAVDVPDGQVPAPGTAALALAALLGLGRARRGSTAGERGRQA